MRFIVVFITAIYIISSCSSGPETVATVGKLQITEDEFRQNLAHRFSEKENYQDVSISEKNQILDQLILRKLKLNEAYEQGIDKQESIVNDYNKRKAQMLSNRYFEKMVIDKLFPENFIRSEFEKTKTEVKARHVLISYKTASRSMNDRSEAEAKTLALDVAQQARKGEKKFYQLALLYSDDATVQQNQGDIGYFTWGQMVEAFQEKAYSMEVGEISDPILTEYGYHIIKLEDKRPNARFKEEDYPEKAEGIKRRLYRIKADTARAMWDNHLAQLKEQMNYTLNTENIDTFLVHNQKRKEDGLLKKENISDEEMAMSLVSWDKGQLTVKDLLNQYGDRIARYHSHLTDSSDLYRDAERIGSHYMIVQIAEKMGLLTEKDIKEQLDNFMEYSLLKVIEKQEVRDKVSYTDEELKKYYAINKKEFTIPEKIEIWEIYSTDKKRAEMAYQAVKRGQRFEKVASNLSEDSYYAKKGGYVGFKAKNTRGAVSKAAFEAGENQLLEPVKYRKGWAVVKTGKIEPETYRSFEQSRNQIINKVKQQKTREREEMWELDLRNKFAVNINEDVLKAI